MMFLSHQKAHSQKVIDILKSSFSKIRLKNVGGVAGKVIIVDDIQTNSREDVLQVHRQAVVTSHAQSFTENFDGALHHWW